MKLSQDEKQIKNEKLKSTYVLQNNLGIRILDLQSMKLKPRKTSL